MAAKALEKRLEAETVTLLKSLLEMELRNVCESYEFDIAMLVGVDGRIFATNIPDVLEAAQYRLLNLVKANLPSICAQLTNEAMKLSLTQYDYGFMMISQVGHRAFLVLLSGTRENVTTMHEKVGHVQRASAVLKHVFEQRPLAPEALVGYDGEIAEELRRLSRQLFVEKFDETPRYRRNMELLTYLKEELKKVVGVGVVDEILSFGFNELGTSAAYMKDDKWLSLVELLVAKVREASGDLLADRCAKAWTPEVKRKLKAFV